MKIVSILHCEQCVCMFMYLLQTTLTVNFVFQTKTLLSLLFLNLAFLLLRKYISGHMIPENWEGNIRTYKH